jgi:hypothetical protein
MVGIIKARLGATSELNIRFVKGGLNSLKSDEYTWNRAIPIPTYRLENNISATVPTSFIPYSFSLSICLFD